MTPESPRAAASGAFWQRTITRISKAGGMSARRIGGLVVLLALLATLATYLLQTALSYPAVLVDRAGLAQAFAAQAPVLAVLAFVCLLASGVLLAVIGLALDAALAADPEAQPRKPRRTLRGGTAAGTLWALDAVVGLALLPLWGHIPTGLTAALAVLVLVTGELAAPLLLAMWTVALSRQLRAHRALGWVGAAGLALVAARSLLWCLDALLSVTAAFYGAADMLSVLAVVGVSFWLLWLLGVGVGLMTRGALRRTRAPRASAPGAGDAGTRAGMVRRRSLLRGALKVGAVVGTGLAGAAFVGVRTGFMIAAMPDLQSDDIPAAPSLMAAGYYLVGLLFLKFVHPINTIADLASQPSASDLTPPPPGQDLAQFGATIEPLSANGVPTERIRAPGASTNRWLLYLHGGGWAVPATSSHRAFVGRLSRELNATGLLPNYRLIPRYPFPAALDDCLAAYRWLRQQGVPAANIVVAGESAGANLTLALALALKQSGEALPAALGSFSPPTDMAMTGATYRTKAWVDPLGGGGVTPDAFALYTDHGATNPRNPLVSPLYGDVRGFPPTIIHAGTQEVFLSDAVRMADKLKAAGVTTKLEVWPGLFHAFTAGPTFIPESRQAERHAVAFMRRYLRG